jgi:hypothetical protein
MQEGLLAKGKREGEKKKRKKLHHLFTLPSSTQNLHSSFDGNALSDISPIYGCGPFQKLSLWSQFLESIL